MKRTKCLLLLTTLLTATLPAARAESLPPGQVDFGTFAQPKSGDFAEINISSSLIGLVSSLVEQKDAEFAQLLKGLHQVRVNVVAVTDENRADLEKRAEKVSQQLDKNGWERVVRAQKDGKNVRVYLKTQGKDAVQGLVVMAMEDGKQAAFVNVVGDIKPSQLSMLGDKLQIDPLKKLHIATSKAGGAEEDN
jgi:Na+-translocating ferredoxin:NAD+ oxidoreductase RnfG subunit